MEAITKLFELDIVSVVVGIFIIISAVVSSLTLISKFMEYMGKPLKWIKNKNKDHELLITTATALSELQKKQHSDIEHSIQHDKEIKEDLRVLTEMFVDKEIDDQRWEILDFASALSSGRKYSNEQFAHVFSIYEKYEKILVRNGMKNGQVTSSMEVINEVYKERLKDGF